MFGSGEVKGYRLYGPNLQKILFSHLPDVGTQNLINKSRRWDLTKAVVTLVFM